MCDLHYPRQDAELAYNQAILELGAARYHLFNLDESDPGHRYARNRIQDLEMAVEEAYENRLNH
jgi:hypothetical protein